MYDRMLTIKEVTDILAISRPTYYRLVEAKKLKIIKIGRAIRIPPYSLKEFVTKEIES